MNTNDVNKLKSKLMPIYECMIKKMSHYNDTIKFCMQWGDEFVNKKGILFCGRANNGWVSFSDDVNVLFDENNPERSFNRENQMSWLNDEYADNGEEKGYRLSRSAFIRSLRKIGYEIFGESWTCKSAWTNLYKIAPNGKNPSNSMCSDQLKSCIDIFKEELAFLKPRAVVMLVGYNWALDFLKALNGGEEPAAVEREYWDKYESKVFKLANTLFIVSEHPQGKKETPHIEAITKLIKKYS